MKLERILDRAIACRDALVLAWRDPYLLYRLRRYKRHLASRAWAMANEYIPRAPTFEEAADSWRARKNAEKNAKRLPMFDYEVVKPGSTWDDAQRMHAAWLEGKTAIPATAPPEKPKS